MLDHVSEHQTIRMLKDAEELFRGPRFTSFMTYVKAGFYQEIPG